MANAATARPALLACLLLAGIVAGCRTPPQQREVSHPGSDEGKMLGSWREKWEAQQRRDSFERMLDQALGEIKGDPRASSPHVRAAVALEELGRREEAKEHLAKAVELAANDPEALQRLALHYMGYGQYEQAVTCLRKVQELDPEMANTGRLLVTTLYSAGEEAAAIEEAKRVLQANPDNYSVRLFYVQRLLEGGDPVQAENLLLDAEVDWHERFELTWQFAEGLHTAVPEEVRKARPGTTIQGLKVAKLHIGEELRAYAFYCRLLLAANILQGSIGEARSWLKLAQEAEYRADDQVRLGDLFAAEGNVEEAKRAYANTTPEVREHLRRRGDRLEEIGPERFSEKIREFVLEHREQYQSGAELPAWGE